MNPPLPSHVAVIDTNVFLDLTSVHDLKRAVDGHAVATGRVDWRRPVVEERFRRVRGSLLLALYLDEIRASTLGAHGESLRMLDRYAPPAPGGKTLVSDYTSFVVHFVMPKLFPGWRHMIPDDRESITGTDVDRMLLGWAKAHDIPLITNEGRNRFGRVNDRRSGGLRRRALREGVDVWTPEEFISGKLKGDEAADRLLGRFAREAPRFLRERRRQIGRDKGSRTLLEFLWDYYAQALLGLPPDLPPSALSRRIAIESLRLKASEPSIIDGWYRAL